jgi:hypothetical protein
MLASLPRSLHGKFGSAPMVRFFEEGVMKPRDIPRDFIFLVVFVF